MTLADPMLRVLALLMCGCATLAGCAGATHSQQLSRALTAKITQEAATQVRRCYRAPKVIGDGRRITTRLQVRYAPDGSIIGLPTIISQSGITPENRMFADDMAEAAIESVVRCSPLHLPPELYQMGWNSFELTFSPALRG